MNQKSPLYVRIFFFLIATCVVVIFSLAFYLGYRAWVESKVPHSAFTYELAERKFIESYVLDQKNGGFNYWVERDGSVKDSKKYSIFQANIILWLGGLESQKHDPKNIELLTKAADYLVKYLYKGGGEWYEFDTSNHRTKQDFYWNPRNETYISYGLLQAYRVTKNKSYLRAAQETNQAQRTKYPNGQINADFGDFKDIGYRFPEHLGHYQEYRTTNSDIALAYTQTYDQYYRGRLGKELLTPDGKAFYYHGMASLGQLIYGYLSNSSTPYDDGSRGRENYWSAQHDDSHHFDTTKPGESSDNGRDYYDKRIAMDLIEWSKRNDGDYQDDALETWEEIKSFWDKQAPYGFLINADEGRKTCFTIGMPMMLMDLTPPRLIESHEVQKGFWNHQMEITAVDPEYTWNDITLRGIGEDPNSVKFNVPFGFTYGDIVAHPGTCEGCVSYTVNFFSPFESAASINVADKFGNNAWLPIHVSSSKLFADWTDINTSSSWFYVVILLALGVTFFTCAIIFYLLSLRQERKRTKQRNK